MALAFRLGCALGMAIAFSALLNLSDSRGGVGLGLLMVVALVGALW